MKVFLGLLALSIGALSSSAAAPPTAKAQLEFFENKVRPLLANHCYKCHSQQAEKVKGGLLLDTREGVLKGGDTGPAVVPGDAEKSLLIKAVRYTDPDLQMPPKDKKLSETEIADLVTWVKMGAPDPREASVAQKNWTDSGKKHWAWQPIKLSPIPAVKNTNWVKTPIDNFILASLEKKNMVPNPQADKRSLIRRATFDLTGLPPTVAEVQGFLEDRSPAAFARVVDRLLQSPRYGERWGRHWLDIARYSDTKGEIKRQREDPNYPFAWTYRDYVIHSFNEDKPYNTFIFEQLAADKLRATASNRTNLTALGFLTVGNRFMGMPNDIVNDRIDVVTKGFLGLTVSCARCHDHKFDPIPTKDYYSLHGVFASSREPDIEPIISKVSNTPEYTDYYNQRMTLEKQKDALEEKFKELRRKRDREGIRLWQRDVRENRAAVAKLEMTHAGAPVRAMSIQDSTRPHDSPVFIRGEAQNRGALVPRRFLEILSGPSRPAWTNGSGRLELAASIANTNNPLTPRVMINRIWMHHFGEGFVPTPDDLGTQSELPSHPELLDYLASSFMTEGWSVKKMHRLIMLSSVYQQSTANNPEYARSDPGNRLLWRANIRRLEIEPLRDSILAIGGTLDTTMYGRPVDLNKQPYSLRRTVYGFIDRSDVPDTLLNFDFAAPDATMGKRYETTVPQQALYLMNNPLVVEQAKNLVARPEFRQLSDNIGRIHYLYERIYQRPARSDGISLGLAFLAQTPSQEKVKASGPSKADPRGMRTKVKEQMAKRRGGKGPPPEFKVHEPLSGWEEYAHALLQANETFYIN